MASASSLSCEVQLRCSICLNTFTEPVSTPCGHNYCKTCITGYWSNKDLIQCPLCKKDFHKRPQLQVNTGFRDMVEHYNNMRVRGEDETPAKPGEVTCDICLEPKLRAQKTCLVCLTSYCQLHLEPHQRVKNLKKHQLIEPVSNPEDRMCKKHDKMFEFFCRQDQKCVCFMCCKDDHVTHEAVPLEQEFRERKAQLDSVMSQVKVMENTKSGNIKEIKHFVRQSRKGSEKEIADITEVFTAPVVSLQSSQAELIQVIQEKQKAAEKEAEDRATLLKQEVAELREKRLEMKELLQTEDHLHFLQSCPVLPFPEHSVIGKVLSQSSDPIDLSDISQPSYVRKVKKAVAQMEKTLSNEMQMLVNQVRLSDGCEADEQSDTDEELMTGEFVTEEWTPPRDKLMMIQQNDAVDVTLDTYTGHPWLAVSEDGKQLRFREGLPSLTGSFGRRFQNKPFVFGKEGFSSGRFYYEVGVSGSKSFLLGVAKESINREIFLACPEAGVWAVGMSINHEGEAYLDISCRRYPRKRPQTIGVFVDYEKGEVSFYDVGARALIHSYTGCTFMESPSALKSLLYSMAGASVSSRPKLYPFFGFLTPGDDPDNMLEITPVAPTPQVPHKSEETKV
ncbi:E3 ubiquitin-protein ligase TRIM39-like [Centropristis striata]|uniref:E3 ubiquitin-protein ligase TRIM39-like n=1 Tax=Centropristis striata TaxID=184440 RepID=UPI0027DFA2FA|nr:E3 ubiquitin-protein ligase TRIM39-like [Centropristis striata]